jgi:hypothetical protein
MRNNNCQHSFKKRRGKVDLTATSGAIASGASVPAIATEVLLIEAVEGEWISDGEVRSPWTRSRSSAMN